MLTRIMCGLSWLAVGRMLLWAMEPAGGTHSKLPKSKGDQQSMEQLRQEYKRVYGKELQIEDLTTTTLPEPPQGVAEEGYRFLRYLWRKIFG